MADYCWVCYCRKCKTEFYHYIDAKIKRCPACGARRWRIKVDKSEPMAVG